MLALSATGDASTWALSGTAATLLGSSLTTGTGMGAALAAVMLSAAPGAPLLLNLTTSIANAAMSIALTLAAGPAPRNTGSCLAIPGTAAVKLLFAAPQWAPAAALPASYNPCTGSLSLGAAGLPATLLTVGSGALEATALALSYTRDGGWVGTLSGLALDGTPTVLFFSPSTTAASLASTNPLVASPLALVFSAYGGATATLTAGCAGGVATYAATVTLRNLPGALPDVEAVTGGALSLQCDATGAYTLVLPLPGPLTYALGADTPTLSSPTLTISGDGSGARTYAFAGTAAGYSGIVLTLSLSAATGAVTVSSTQTARRALGDARELVMGASITSFLAGFSFSASLPSFAGTLFADIVAPVLASPLGGVSVTTNDEGCLALTGTTSALWGAAMGTSITALSCAATPAGAPSSYILTVALDLSGINLLPSALGLSALSGLVAPALSISTAGVVFSAQSAVIKGLTLSGLSMSFAEESPATSPASYSAAGTATATLSGVAVAVAATRTAGTWALTLSVDTTASKLPFEVVASLSYDNAGGSASGSGSLTSLRVPMGKRALALAGGSGSSTITFSNGAWTIAASLPGANFGGVTCSSLTFYATTNGAGGGTWSVSAFGSAALGAQSATLSVALGPGPGVYAVTLSSAITTAALDMVLSVALASDGGECSAFAGTLDTLSLRLGRAGTASLSGLSAVYSSCDGSIAIATSAPSPLTLLDASVTLQSLALQRASASAGWEGSLTVAVAGALPLPSSWKSKQAFTLSFSDSALASASLVFTAHQGSAISMAGSLSYTPPSACAPAMVDTAAISLSASVPLPPGSSGEDLSLAGSATLTRACSGAAGFSAQLLLDSPLELDLGASTVSLSSLALAYSSGGAPPASSVVSLSGVLGDSVLVSINMETGGTTPTSSLSAGLLAPTSLGSVVALLSGEMPDAPKAMGGPILSASVTALGVSVAKEERAKCVYLLAAVDSLFGGVNVAVSGRLCKQSNGLTGMLGVLVDPAAMGASLPGAAKAVFKYLPAPSINFAFGAPARGTVTGTAVDLPADLIPSGATLPTLLNGVQGVCFTGSLATAGNAISDLIGAIGKGGGGLARGLRSVGSNTYVSACMDASGSGSYRVSAAFAPDSDSLS